MALKKTKKIISFHKQIDERIKVVDEKFDAMENPFILDAKKALNLKHHDFSIHDHMKTDEIISQKKFQAHVDRIAKQKHQDIEIYKV